MHFLQQLTVLYVEDENHIREGYSKVLKRHFKEVFCASDGLEGLEMYKQYLPDIVITDIRMPNKNGIEMAKDILNITPKQIIVFTTAHSESEYTMQALEMQVSGYMLKPVDKNKLVEKLNNLAENLLANRENIKHQKAIQSILNTQSNILILTDLEDIEFASKSFFDLFNVTNKEEFSQKFKRFIDIFSPCDDCCCIKSKNDFIKSYKDNAECQKIVSISYDGHVKKYQIKIDTVMTESEELYVVSLWDVTSLHEEKLNAEFRADYDELTKVYTRVKFNDIYEIEFLRAQRYQREFSLAILDIDHFKSINDQFGHLIGDEVLQKFAKYCLDNLRSTDLFFRWGGEEFVLILSETSQEQASLVCEKLRRGLTELEFPFGIILSISIGLSSIRENDSKNGLFERADKALFKAKQSGRNQVVVSEKTRYAN
ncbi:MAG: diguanylate cyclase [Sulfurospirillaceae bacterium]|nr:diguanylate cyclase [Sulfurospirillaceae bacterium]